MMPLLPVSLFPPYTAPVHDALDALSDFELLGAGLACLIFVISYASFFNWRKTKAGAAIFYLLSSLVLVLLHTILAKASGGADFPGRSIIRAAVYLLPLAAGVRIVYVLWWNYFHASKLLDLQRRPHGGGAPRTTLADGESTRPRRYTRD